MSNEEIARRVRAYLDAGHPLTSPGGNRPSAMSLSGLDAIREGLVRTDVQWRRRVYAAIRAGHLMPLQATPAPPGYEIRQRTVTEDASGTVVRTSVQQRQAPGRQFTVPDGHYVKGRSALIDGDGRTLQQWIKTDIERASRWQAMERGIRDAFSSLAGGAPHVVPPDGDTDLLQLYVIADLHFGLYAWGRETGTDYDIGVASDAVRTGIGSLVRRSPPAGTGILVILGDYYHANDSKARTPASGHVLDVDTRFNKVCREGAWLARDAVELIRRHHSSVHVVVLPGNHDPEAAMHLAIALELYYHHEEAVTVRTDPSLWWWHVHGDVFIGAHHGHGLSGTDIPAIASDAARGLGITPQHMHVHLGHLHKKAGDEKYGVRWEIHRAIATSDAYHAGLWLRGPSTMDAITYHARTGERGRATERVIEPRMVGA